MDTKWISFFFFGLAGVVHFFFFILESFLMQKAGAHRRLKISEEAHQAIKPWAFNQGFYNLFFAVGIFIGLYLVTQKMVMLAGLLTSFCGLSMLLAGIVLWFSAPPMRKWAYVQILPPLLGFLFLFSHVAPAFRG